MIVWMNSGATKDQIQAVLNKAESLGREYYLSERGEPTIIAVDEGPGKIEEGIFESIEGVRKICLPRSELPRRQEAAIA